MIAFLLTKKRWIFREEGGAVDVVKTAVNASAIVA